MFVLGSQSTGAESTDSAQVPSSDFYTSAGPGPGSAVGLLLLKIVTDFVTDYNKQYHQDW